MASIRLSIIDVGSYEGVLVWKRMCKTDSFACEEVHFSDAIRWRNQSIKIRELHKILYADCWLLMVLSIMAAGPIACALPLTPPWRYSDISDGSHFDFDPPTPGGSSTERHNRDRILRTIIKLIIGSDLPKLNALSLSTIQNCFKNHVSISILFFFFTFLF